jgi:hypothetical protein
MHGLQTNLREKITIKMIAHTEERYFYYRMTITYAQEDAMEVEALISHLFLNFGVDQVRNLQSSRTVAHQTIDDLRTGTTKQN